jgi:hypothetical protein
LQAQKFDFKAQPFIVPTVDWSVLTATTAYWVYYDNVQPDKVIHFLFGYFATSAMNRLLQPLDLPKFMKVCTPVLVFGGLSFFKEVFLDGKPDWNDFKAGMIGCGISVVSFNLIYRF